MKHSRSIRERRKIIAILQQTNSFEIFLVIFLLFITTAISIKMMCSKPDESGFYFLLCSYLVIFLYTYRRYKKIGIH